MILPAHDCVTVLMAVRNGAQTLPAQLDSLAAQSHANWRLIASDDGSTDGSRAILQRFAQGRVTLGQVAVVEGPGQGFVANFLSLLARPGVSGPVALSDQDDIWFPDKLQRALARLATPIAKYWVCKRAPGMVYEAMESLGGAGYVETGPMPRLFRQSPLNAIWEGSGNVIALDVLRAFGREPESVAALRSFLEARRGPDAVYDAWIADLDLTEASEANARWTVERLALALQAAVLLESESPIAHLFCRLRLQPQGRFYGAVDGAIDTRRVLDRALPR